MKLLSERFRPNGSIIETFKVDYSEGFCFFVFPLPTEKVLRVEGREWWIGVGFILAGLSSPLISCDLSWRPDSNILGNWALLVNRTQGSPELSSLWLKPFLSLRLLVYIVFSHILGSYPKRVLSWVDCEGPECGLCLDPNWTSHGDYPAEVSSLAVKLGFVLVPWIMTRNHLQWRRQMRR